jgi:hypothetical protein
MHDSNSTFAQVDSFTSGKVAGQLRAAMLPETKKKAARQRAGRPFKTKWLCLLRTRYVLRLETFRAPLHLELHFRAFFKRSIAAHLNRRKMHEYVIAI